MSRPGGQLETSAERTIIDTTVGPVAALQTGSGARPVLLVPGYTGSKEDFAPILAAIADAGFAATAIDLPGQYESPGPADPSWYRPDELGRVVREVARQLGPSVQLVGHSFGGLVARAAVIAEPTAFAALVVMGSGPSGIGGERRALVEALEPVLAASGLAAVYATSLAVARARAGYVEPPPPMAAFLERRFLAGTPAMLQGMGEALRREPDRVAELAATGVATLVLHGVDDDAWPPAVQRDMAERLGADHVVVPDAAHSPAVENPVATTAALVRFWHRV